VPRAVVAVSLGALALLAVAAPARATALEGAWIVADATTDSDSRVNRKLLNSHLDVPRSRAGR
jgi:hypothetical protein